MSSTLFCRLVSSPHEVRRLPGRAFSLIELLVAIAVIVLLVGILLPSLTRVKELARRAVCRSSQHALLTGLHARACEHDRSFPSFMFSSPLDPDLALSGHWGGTENLQSHPVRYTWSEPSEETKQYALRRINLHGVTTDHYAPAETLICPSAEPAFEDGSSYYADSKLFSTHCLRFPPSEDLFRNVPSIMGEGDDLLRFFQFTPGGYPVRVGSEKYDLPLVRLNRQYRSFGRVFDPARDAVLADAFWMREVETPAAGGDNAVRRPVCHEGVYNVAYGDGSVVEVTDDGQVADLACPAGEVPARDPAGHAEQAEDIWSVFDQARQ